MRLVSNSNTLSQEFHSEQEAALEVSIPAKKTFQLPQGTHDSQSRDLLSEFKANLDLVEDLAFRMRFMTREVSQLVKPKSR